MGMNYSTEGIKGSAYLNIVPLIRLMRDYGHELLSSRASWVTCNSPIKVHDIKDLGDIVNSWIHPPHSHAHLLESWNKLLEVVEGSSKGLIGTLSKGLEELSKLNLNFTLNLNY